MEMGRPLSAAGFAGSSRYGRSNKTEPQPRRKCGGAAGVNFMILTFTHMHTRYSHLIIVRWKLVEELLDSELLSRTVHIGCLILGQAGEI